MRIKRAEGYAQNGRIVGYAPQADGEVVQYAWRGSLGPGGWGRSIVYVNGILTSAETHRNTCLKLSWMTNCSVYGIYNASDSLLSDLRQSLEDGLDAYSGRAFSDNRAAQSICRLTSEVFAGRQRMAIVAHSQGNLITAAAMAAIVRQGSPKPRSIAVLALASPILDFPPSLKVSTFSFPLDVVPDLPEVFRAVRRELGGANDLAPVGNGDISTSPSWNPLENHDVNTILRNRLRQKLQDLGFGGGQDAQPAPAPAAARVPTPPAVPAGPRVPTRSYTVRVGDTLHSIAQIHLRNGERWPEIHRLNTLAIPNPRSIPAGISIQIPVR